MTRKLLVIAVVLYFVLSPGLADAKRISTDGQGEAYHPLITVVEGDVTIKGTRYLVWEPAEVGTLLYSGDIVRTGSGAKAEVRFLSGKIELYENSLVMIPSTGVQYRKKDLKEIFVKDGSVLFDINPTGVRREFEFRTKNVQGGVKGTMFTVSYLREATSVKVYRGKVEVSDPDRNEDTKVLLKAGESVKIREKADFGIVSVFDADAALADKDVNVSPTLDADEPTDKDNNGVRDHGEGIGRIKDDKDK